MNDKNSTLGFGQASLRLGLCVAVLGIGFFGMISLAKMKAPPAKAKINERTLRVNAVRVVPEDVSVKIAGHGEARSLNEVVLSPEVPGKATAVHPRLEVGEIIPKGEVLFRIDSINYEADLKEAQAAIQERENAIIALKQQMSLDREGLEIQERNKALATAEHKRLLDLFEKDNIGTRSRVEAAEQALNNAASQVQRLSQTIDLYPIQIQQAESSLASASARLVRAEANLARCTVAAPFNARVKQVNMEKGQYATPGFQAVTLADDSQLEIQIPLDSQDAKRWLRFKNGSNHGTSAWFGDLEPVEADVRWTEDPHGHAWKGRLHRVVKFDQQTRTLLVAVRIDAEAAVSADPARMPLVDGMFCSVEIPGKTLENVFRLPRAAVSFENTVYVSIDNRLKTIPVSVARTEGDFAFIESGLKEGDIVIASRLVEPLEGSLLDVDFGESLPGNAPQSPGNQENTSVAEGDEP